MCREPERRLLDGLNESKLAVWCSCTRSEKLSPVLQESLSRYFCSSILFCSRCLTSILSLTSGRVWRGYSALLGRNYSYKCSSVEMVWKKEKEKKKHHRMALRDALWEYSKSSYWRRIQYLFLPLKPAVHHGMVGTE